MQTDETQAESLGTRAEIAHEGGCKRRMKATVPAAKVVEELDRNYQDLAKTVQIPGFRKGRVPRSLLESRYGEEIESEVKESIIAASFSEVIEERELQVFSSPKFENVVFDPAADLTYEVEFEVRPEFELPEYKGVEVDAVQSEFSEDDVAAELEKIRRRLVTLEPAKPGDIGEDGYLRGSYSLFIDGNEVKQSDELSFQPRTGVLENFYIEDLSERIAGWDWSTQSPMVFEVKVPAHYPDEVLRGRDARLELVVSEGFDMKLPELDDELAKASGHESLDELRKEIRETLQRRREREFERAIEDAILEKLAAQTEIEVPEALVESQVRRNRASQEQILLEQGFTPEQIEEFFATQAAAEEEGTDEPAESAAAEDAGEGRSSEGQSSGVVSFAAGAGEAAAPPEEATGEAADVSGEAKDKDDATTDGIRQTAKKYFILEAIAEKEKIFVTEQNVEQKLILMAEQYGMRPDRLREELEKTDRLSELRLSLKHDKVREFLRSKARVASAAAGGREAAGSVADGTADGTSDDAGPGPERGPETGDQT